MDKTNAKVVMEELTMMLIAIRQPMAGDISERISLEFYTSYSGSCF